MDYKNSIETLQKYVTGLTFSALVHKFQGQIFKSQGFNKLADKYASHYTEENGWVEKFVDRILDLGGELKEEGIPQWKLTADPVEYIKAHKETQQKGLADLYKAVESVKDDPTTYDLLKDYLADEEEDLYWDEETLALIEKIGVQNWLTKQL